MKQAAGTLSIRINRLFTKSIQRDALSCLAKLRATTALPLQLFYSNTASILQRHCNRFAADLQRACSESATCMQKNKPKRRPEFGIRSRAITSHGDLRLKAKVHWLSVVYSCLFRMRGRQASRLQTRGADYTAEHDALFCEGREAGVTCASKKGCGRQERFISLRRR